MNSRPTPYQGVRRGTSSPNTASPPDPNSTEGRYARKCTSPSARCATPRVSQINADSAGRLWSTCRPAAGVGHNGKSSGDSTLVCATALAPGLPHGCRARAVDYPSSREFSGSLHEVAAATRLNRAGRFYMGRNPSRMQHPFNDACVQSAHQSRVGTASLAEDAVARDDPLALHLISTSQLL